MEILKDFVMLEEYWAVGSSFGRTDDQTIDFLENSYWRDGWGLENRGNNKTKLMQVNTGDYFIMKSSATRGINHAISFTRVKAVGKIIDRTNWFTFSIKWL